MLTVVASAASMALTTLEAVKAALSIAGGDDDTFLSDLIDQASAAAAAYCNRVFGLETVAETFRIDRATDLLVLSRWPVASVVSIVAGGAWLAADGWEVDADNGDLYRLGTADQRKVWPIGKTVVTYSAGYVLPGAEGRDLPADIEAAVIALVRLAYARRGADPLLKSVGLGDARMDYYSAPLGSEGGLPAEVAGTLDRHRAPVVG
jgi:hypothetical protein